MSNMNEEQMKKMLEELASLRKEKKDKVKRYYWTKQGIRKRKIKKIFA